MIPKTTSQLILKVLTDKEEESDGASGRKVDVQNARLTYFERHEHMTDFVVAKVVAAEDVNELTKSYWEEGPSLVVKARHRT